VTKTDSNYLEKLVAEYQPQLKSFIRKRVGNREEAEDILQDVFYQLVKTVNAAMNPIEPISAWLFRVAKNTIINHGIKKHEEELPVYYNDDNETEIMQEFSDALFNETASSPETEYLNSLIWIELENALAELPPEQREIYELTEFDSIPVKEIAKTTGIPVNTLLSRKHYAVLYLRKRLKDLYCDLMD
jgi:RNA polymerase sigma factor (sigma-70 family)